MIPDEQSLEWEGAEEAVDEMSTGTVERLDAESFLVGDDETWEIAVTPRTGHETDTVTGLTAEMRALGWELQAMRVEPYSQHMICTFVPMK